MPAAQSQSQQQFLKEAVAGVGRRSLQVAAVSVS